MVLNKVITKAKNYKELLTKQRGSLLSYSSGNTPVYRNTTHVKLPKNIEGFLDQRKEYLENINKPIHEVYRISSEKFLIINVTDF